jgi:uridylate kinase
VDGVYDADPHRFPKAKKYKSLTLLQALRDQLGVMDATALSLCLENKIPVRVFSLKEPGNIRRAIAGENVGTLVTPLTREVHPCPTLLPRSSPSSKKPKTK